MESLFQRTFQLDEIDLIKVQKREEPKKSDFIKKKQNGGVLIVRNSFVRIVKVGIIR